jgi:hypothetical protein
MACFVLISTFDNGVAWKGRGMISGRTSIVRTTPFACVTCIAKLSSMRIAEQGFTASGQANPPEARSPIDLTAISNPNTGRAALLFNRRVDPPVIRASPGEQLRMTFRGISLFH